MPPADDASVDATSFDASAEPAPTDAPAEEDVAGDAGSDADAAAFPFVPSNIPPSALDFTAVDDVELSDTHGCAIDTSTGTITCTDAGIAARFHFVSVNQPGSDAGPGVPLGVFAAKSLKIDPQVTVNVVTSVPVLLDSGLPAPTPALAFVVSGDVDVEGTLQTPVAFEPTFAFHSYAAGSRPPAPNFASLAGGSFCGTGGPATANGNVNPPLVLPALVPLVGGQAGASDPYYFYFAAGGGAIELVAGGSLLIGASGVISVPGYTDNYTNGGATIIGGGSGGAILLEASSVRVTGTLTANGATGGSGGGSGSSGTSINGAAGNGGGAGGGGAGTIRLNSRTGIATLDPQSAISPATSSPCFTQGILH